VVNADSLTPPAAIRYQWDKSATASPAQGPSPLSAGNLTRSIATAATVINASGLTAVAAILDISGDTSATAIGARGPTTRRRQSQTADNDTAANDHRCRQPRHSRWHLVHLQRDSGDIDPGALIQAAHRHRRQTGFVHLDLICAGQRRPDVSITINHRLLTIDIPDLTTVDGKTLTISAITDDARPSSMREPDQPVAAISTSQHDVADHHQTPAPLTTVAQRHHRAFPRRHRRAKRARPGGGSRARGSTICTRRR